MKVFLFPGKPLAQVWVLILLMAFPFAKDHSAQQTRVRGEFSGQEPLSWASRKVGHPPKLPQTSQEGQRKRGRK